MTLFLYILWIAVGSDSFIYHLHIRPHLRYLRWSRYKRRWENLCHAHNLTITTRDHTEQTPRIRSITINNHYDEIRVELLPGQSVKTWTNQKDALTHFFKAHTLTITSPEPGYILLTVQYSDSLHSPIAGTITDTSQLTHTSSHENTSSLSYATTSIKGIFSIPIGKNLQIGITERNQPWLVDVLGNHILIAGATGSGKGSIIWSLIHAMRNDIYSGLIQPYVIDPKGGMELGLGAPLFHRFSYEGIDTHIHMLHDLVEIMQHRAQNLRGTTRLHTPTRAEPLIVVIIDELASLTAYVPDRKHKQEAETLLSLLLSQGRAVGISVIAALQDPSKDVLPFRQLFPTRIGLRLTEASQTQMILGVGAHEAGAYCELIPETTPGVAYMIQDGSNQAIRARAYHVTDTNIHDLTSTYPAPARKPIKEDGNS